jgi:hypothetical protein
VGEFEAVLRKQVAQAAAALKAAHSDGDFEAEQAASGNLADLLAIATEHGVDVSEALGDVNSEAPGEI